MRPAVFGGRTTDRQAYARWPRRAAAVRGKNVEVPDNDPSPRPNFAYRVPRNVYAPGADEWLTLVRPDRIRVGDVLDD